MGRHTHVKITYEAFKEKQKIQLVTFYKPESRRASLVLIGISLLSRKQQLFLLLVIQKNSSSTSNNDGDTIS